MARLGPTIWLGLLAAAGGCASQDADCLGRVARRAAAKGEELAAGTGWPAAPANLALWSVEARVAARLHWDKGCESAEIQPTLADGVLELRGSVRDADQRRRAVELAEATAGVEKVNDRLEVRSAEP
jgi:hypothetical protein